jgi:hypothetical protein
MWRIHFILGDVGEAFVWILVRRMCLVVVLRLLEVKVLLML